MALIPTRIHAAGDYAGGALMIAAAELPLIRDRRAAAILRVAGAGTLVASALTDYELGLWRKLPMPVHLGLDAAAGALMTAGAMLLRRDGAEVASWLPHAVVGLSEVAVAAVTDRRPGDAPSHRGFDGDLPAAVVGVTGEGVAARQNSGAAPIAPPPAETPGPSVTPPEQPESETERAERIDSRLVDPSATDDVLIAQEEAAAGAEAASIGGVAASETGDPAMDPVYEAGGGDQDGWEAAEADLVENATHGEGHGEPLRDALTPEAEADRSTAVYGEGDRIPSTEVVDDPGTGPDDPGRGPGLGAERGPGLQPRQD